MKYIPLEHDARVLDNMQQVAQPLTILKMRQFNNRKITFKLTNDNKHTQITISTESDSSSMTNFSMCVCVC